MNEITVTNQNELDAIPLDFHGRIYVKFGTPSNPAILRYALGNSSAVLCGNASAVLWENSSAVLWENSSAVLWGNSNAELRGNASAVLRENSSAVLRENSSAVLRENSSAVLWGNSSAVLWGNSNAELCGNSSAELCGNSSAVLRGNASAVLRENSSAVLRENSSAVLWGNSQIVDRSRTHAINCYGNSRIVYMPKTAEEYLDFYGLNHGDDFCTLYKAVRKISGRFASDRDHNFEYLIGEEKVSDYFDKNRANSCGAGINMAPLNWCLDYGRNWRNLAILEMRVKISDVLVPDDSDGKVRAPKAFVVREVPKSEWGLYGEILFGKDTK